MANDEPRREPDLVALIRENERMRMALTAIQAKARAAVFGGWRQEVYDMATEGLKR